MINLLNSALSQALSSSGLAAASAPSNIVNPNWQSYITPQKSNYSIEDFFAAPSRNVGARQAVNPAMGLSYEQLAARTQAKEPISIDDILSGIQSQYYSRPTASQAKTIDDVLSKLTYSPTAVAPMSYGARQFIGEVAPTQAFTPAAFDAQKFKMDYESATDKAQRIYNETYASEIAAGRSKAEAQKKAQETAQKWSTIGGLAGMAAGIPGGGFLGSTIGTFAAPVLEGVSDAVGGFVQDVGDFLGF